VQVKIRQDRRSHRPLRRPFLRLVPLLLLQHARLHPSLDPDSPRRSRSIGPAMDPSRKVPQPLLQAFPIFLPPHPVRPWRHLSLQAVIALPEQIHGHMVQRGGESLLVIPSALLAAHGPARLARSPGPVSGTSWSVPRSPWSAAFHPHPPPPVSRPCSDASSVLCRCTTPHRRASGPYRSSLSPRGPLSCHGRPGGLPVLAPGVSAPALLYHSAGWPGTRAIAPALWPFPWRDTVGSLKSLISELDTKPTPTPCPSLQVRPRSRPRMARGQDGSLLHAGLSRRYPR